MLRKLRLLQKNGFLKKKEKRVFVNQRSEILISSRKF